MEEQQTPAEKDTPLSSQVLEYYRNYSQDVQLPRYFCGETPNSVVISEDIQHEHDNIADRIQRFNMARRPPLIGQDHSMTSVVPPTVIITDVNSDNRAQVSPTSSVTSNRKLEWDNGADIGYENCEVSNRNLFRSCSLPTLNTLERSIQKELLRHSPDGRIAETTQKNIVSKNSYSSTDSTTKMPQNSSTITTTTNDNQTRKPSTSGQSSSIEISSKPRDKIYTTSSSSSASRKSDNNDQHIIYMPVLVNSPPLAESTPNLSDKYSSKDTVYYETPIMTHPRKPPRKNAIFTKANTPIKSKSTSFDDLQNLQKLDETLKNRSKYLHRYLIEKQQNLCITKPASVEYINNSHKDNASIAIQTENLQTMSPKRQLIYLDHYVSDKENSSSSDNSSKIVDCNSFEYLYGSAIDQNGNSAVFQEVLIDKPIEDKVQTVKKIDNVQEIVQNVGPNKLKHSNTKYDIKHVTPTETNSSESKSEGISSKLSNNLISDVEKSVDLLAKLLKSKKYDQDAKKYYIRKIVRKIVDTKYVDDRTSSTAASSTSTNKTTNESNTSEVPEEKYQKQAVAPEMDPPLILTERQSKSEANLQDVDIYPRLQRNPRFTLTNNEFFVAHAKGDDNDNTSSDLFRPHSRHVFPSYTTDSSVDKMQDTHRSSPSWKDDKTASERLMESQTPITEESDELVGFAQRERQSQLNWISNEINHLSKLKSLLEKKEYKPAITQQSTAVYMITTDKNSNRSSRQCCTCHRINVPNVISTTATPGHHHIKLQCCKHHQQEYRVRHIDSNCLYHQQYTRNYQRTAPPSTSAMPTSSDDQRKTLLSTYKEQTIPNRNFQEQIVQKDADTEISPVCTSMGVTCTLLPTRAAIIASKLSQNIHNAERNVAKPSGISQRSKPTRILPKSTFAPTSVGTIPKKQSANPAKSKKEVGSSLDITNKARLISSDLYQSNDCPTTSVRRYVFEIPIMDLQANKDVLDKKKSSNFANSKMENKEINDVDFEVRNVHLTRTDEDKNNEQEVSDPKGRHDDKKKVTSKQFEVINTEDLLKKRLSQDKFASYENDSSISREIIPISSDKFDSIDSLNRGTMKYSIPSNSSLMPNTPLTDNPNKITQTVEHIGTNTYKILAQKKVLSNDEDGMRKSTASQTSSLENYMKQLIAETMKRNNWEHRKFSSDHPKSTTSDREPSINNIHEKADNSVKRKSQEDAKLRSESSDDYHQMPKPQETFLEHRPGYISDSREKQIDGNLSPDVIIQKFVEDFATVDKTNEYLIRDERKTKNDDYIKKDRSLERYSKNIPSDKFTTSNNTQKIMSKDRPDAKLVTSNMDEAALDENGSKMDKYRKTSGEDGSKRKVSKDMKKRLDDEKMETIQREMGDSGSNSSESKSSSDTSSSSITYNEVTKVCQCCRNNNISLDNIMAEAIHHPLCQTCFQTHQDSLWKNHQPFYMYANHICNCYTLLKTQQIQAIKTTINELQTLENKGPNPCVCPPNKKISQKDKCLNCNCPLRTSAKQHHDTNRTRKPSRKSQGKDERHKHDEITYTLKLETATEDDGTVDKIEDKIAGRYEEEVLVKLPNRRGKRGTKGSVDMGNKEENLEDEDEEVKKEKKNYDGRSNKGKKKNKRKITKTLQDYLSMNRPAFIESAEQRRKCLIELAYMREERCQKYKQLLAMTNGVPMLPNGQNPQNSGLILQKPRIFSTKEMKRLTAKNYKKLPEVQKRLFDNKERQLKKANRLLSDIFNKKLRDKVLKGQPSLSTSVSIINLM